MRFYGFAESFEREAKTAELSQAKLSIKFKHLKAAFIGSKLTIARLIVMLLPAAALLLSSGTVKLCLPFVENAGCSFSVLGLVSLFTDGNLNYFLSMAGSEFAGGVIKPFLAALSVYSLAVLAAVLVFLFSLLCFISIKNMQKIICAVSALGFISCCVSAVMTGRLGSAFAGGPLLEQSSFSPAGLLVPAVCFIAVFAVNLMLCKKGIPVEYEEGIKERFEIYKKVKSGEINIDDLPQPVVETEETRRIDEEIRKEEEAYNRKHGINGEEAQENE